MTPARRKEVQASITAASTPSRSYYILVMLSTIIATYGMLANSTAVVIGAMLVAPLMAPIFGIALALVTGNQRLLRRAMISEVLGVLLAVALGAAIGLLPLRAAFGPEVVARTQPTLYDIIIALASGLAGAYALLDEKVSPALPGVALAVALMPPLATCGLCLSAGRYDWALGAFLLFLANFLAIEIVAAVVFTAFGMSEMRGEKSGTWRGFLRQFGPSLGLLLAMTVFMTHALAAIIADRQLSETLRAAVSRQLLTMAGAQLTDLRHQRRGGEVEVTAVALTPREIEPVQVARIEENLCAEIDPNIRLVMRSLLSRDADRYGPAYISAEERTRQAEVGRQTEFLTRASAALGTYLETMPGAHLADVQRHREEEDEVLTAVVRTPQPVSPEQVREMETAARNAVGKQLRLIVRSILTRDADADRYLYEPEKESRPLSGDDLALHRRLEGALKRHLGRHVEGALLSEFRFARRGERVLVLAVVRTPRVVVPAQTREIEAAFRQHIHPGIDLIVRSVVGAETASTGYLTGFDEAKLGSGGQRGAVRRHHIRCEPLRSANHRGAEHAEYRRR